MGLEWGQPKWRQQGRTGPGPAAPKYKSAKARRAVQRGGSPGDGKGCAMIVVAVGSLVSSAVGGIIYVIGQELF